MDIEDIEDVPFLYLSLGRPHLQIEEGVLVAMRKEQVTYLDCEATIDELLQDEIIVHDL